MKNCLSLLSIVITLFIPLPAMSFCRVPQPRLGCAEYFASQLVVEVTLVDIQTLHDTDDPLGISAHVYTLRVIKVFRGKIDESLQVYEGNDSGRATFDWVQGRKYLLFLFYMEKEKSWALDGCGNSGPLNQAKMALSVISAIKTASGGGVIYGVVKEPALSTPIPGVHIEARGENRHFVTSTNEKGEFQIKVPAGQYIVRTSVNGSSFGTDLSYEDPRTIRLEPGGCAQIQFVRDERPPTQ